MTFDYAFFDWYLASETEAQRRLPHLLELDAADLDRELAHHPEWQPGIVQVLLDRIGTAIDQDPSRAHDLTSVILDHAGRNLPLRRAWIAAWQKCGAWTSHARTLFALRRYAEARDAIATASDFCRHIEVGNSWATGIATVVEAEILHGLGKSEKALRLIPPAAAMFRLSRQDDRYAAATMLEAQIHRDAGDLAAAEEVWRTARDEPFLVLDRRLAYVDWCLGKYQLWNGDARNAQGSFERAHVLFHACEQPHDATRARLGIARAASLLGQFDKAARLYRRVQAELLARNNLLDAAIASTELLDVFVFAGYTTRVLPLAKSLVLKFGKAGLPLNAMHAWIFVRKRGRALTRQDVGAVRGYFERLALRPNAGWEG